MPAANPIAMPSERTPSRTPHICFDLLAQNDYGSPKQEGPMD
jgi:hypothetical protein